MTSVSQHQTAVPTTPSRSDALDAWVVRDQDAALAAVHNAHDANRSVHVESGLLSARPAFGTAGATYISIDAGVVRAFIDTGSAWEEVDYAAPAHTHAWADITGKPTTLAGYGITDAVNTVNPVTSGSGTHTGGKITLAATAAGYASANLPHGTAPSAPANGDLWTTSAGGLYVRVNGATKGPLIAADDLPSSYYWNDAAQVGANTSVAVGAITRMNLPAGNANGITQATNVLTIQNAGWYLVSAVISYVSGTFTVTSITYRAANSGGATVYCDVPHIADVLPGSISFVRYFAASSTLEFAMFYTGIDSPLVFRVDSASVVRVK